MIASKSFQSLTSCVSVVVPLLILLPIVVEFLSFHSYALSLPESIALMSIAAVIGLMMGIMTLVRAEVTTPMIIAIAVVLFVSRKSLYDAFEALLGEAVVSAVGQANVSAAYYFCLLMAAASVCWLLRKHLCSIAVTIFGVIVLSALILPSNKATQVVVQDWKAPSRLNSLPPVIHIILDGQIGVAGMPDTVDGHKAAKETLLKTYNGFKVFERGFSLFAQTKYSVASMMNGLVGLPGSDILEEKGSTHRLLRNRWFNKLKAKGYRTHVYQTTWLDMCSSPDLISSCYTYPIHGINPIQRSSLSSAQRIRLLGYKILADKGFSVFAIPQLTPLPAWEALQRFEADLADAQNGDAFIAHILLPHEGYLYASDCSLLPIDKWGKLYVSAKKDAQSIKILRARNYRNYFEQMRCTSRRIGQVFQRLRDLGLYDHATIIVHGDHGSRITDQKPALSFSDDVSGNEILDLYSTLLAIKEPRTKAAIVTTPKSVQHYFAEQIFNEPPTTSDGSESKVHYLNPDDVVVERSIPWPK